MNNAKKEANDLDIQLKNANENVSQGQIKVAEHTKSQLHLANKIPDLKKDEAEKAAILQTLNITKIKLDEEKSSAQNALQNIINQINLINNDIVRESEIKEDAKKLLIDRFGWQPYPQKHFESRFTKFYESYWLPERFGYDVRKVQYSSLIVTEQMTREDALSLLKQPTYDHVTIAQEIEFVANKLDITVKELKSYLTLPKKTYRDYRSQNGIYRVGAKVMRSLGLEIGGKR